MPKVATKATRRSKAVQAPPAHSQELAAALTAPLSVANLLEVQRLHRGDPLPAIPAVFDLGRHQEALWTVRSEFDRAILAAAENDNARKHSLRAGFDAAQHEIDAVQSLMFARPVHTLADATALAVLGFVKTDGFARSQCAADSGRADEAEQWRAAFARIALVTAEAGGVDLLEVASEATVTLLRRRAGVEHAGGQTVDAELVALACAIETEYHETDAMDAAHDGKPGAAAFLESSIRPRVARSGNARATRCPAGPDAGRLAR